jgi:hypothetical protein
MALAAFGRACHMKSSITGESRRVLYFTGALPV